MKEILLSYFWVLFIILAAICNAIMDTIQHHFEKSIFKDIDKENSGFWYWWWNPYLSWYNKYEDRNPAKPIRKIFFGLFDRPFTDAWHTFKSLMIICLAFALASAAHFYKPFITYLESILIFGLIWNTTFNLFYNKILRK